MQNSATGTRECRSDCESWIGAYVDPYPYFITGIQDRDWSYCNVALNNTGNAGIFLVAYSGDEIDKRRQAQKSAGSHCLRAGTACGNPINTGTGNKFQEETDFDLGAGLEFKRYYNSLGEMAWAQLGARWRHSYSLKIDHAKDAQGKETATLFRADGRTVSFEWTGDRWLAEAGEFSKLSSSRDGAGKILGWTYHENGASHAELYDAAGRIVSIRGGLGEQLSFEYSTSSTSSAIAPRPGLLIAVTNYLGRSLIFTYRADSQIGSVSLPDGSAYTYAYSGGLLVSVSKPGGSTRGYVYNEQALTTGSSLPQALTGIVDEKGQRFASFGYNWVGEAISTEHAGGVERYVLSRNPDGSATITTASGSSIVRRFSVVHDRVLRASDTISCTGCSSQTRQWSFDESGLPDVSIDAAGTIEDSDYDEFGLLIQVVRAKGTPEQRAETLHWDTTLRTPRQIDRAGQRQTYTYNSRGQILAVTLTDVAAGRSRTSSLTYCETADVAAGICPLVGLVTSANGPRTDVGDISTYSYYASDAAGCATVPTTCPYRKGDLWKVTNAAGQVVEILAYNANGRILSMKDANGVITDLEYHSRGWLIARKVRGFDSGTEADDAITRMDVNEAGQIARVTLPDGSFISYAYDAAHRLTGIADNSGNSVTYTLNSSGDRIKEDTKNGNGVLKRTLSRVYNGLGQLQTIADATATPADFTYNAEGTVNTITDALSRVGGSDFDLLGHLKRSVVNATGTGVEKGTTQFQYDARDNLIGVIDPKGLPTNYGYDGLDDITQLVSPDTGTTIYGYDSAGNRSSQLDARGKLTTYSYDALNRLISQSVSNSAQNIYFDYDLPQADCLAGEMSGAGRLARIRDESGSTRFCYDRSGHLVRKVQSVIGGPTLTVGSTYNSTGRLVAMTYPSGAIVTYLRDANGQITGITAKPTAVAAQISLVSSVAYLPFGPLNTLTFGSGRVMTKAYDQNYGIDKVSDSGVDGLSEDFTLNAVGNITGVVERTTTSAMTTRSFAYDGQDRLAALKSGGSLVQGFTYDATGNRLSKTLGSTTTTNIYDPASHRLTQTGAVMLTYDSNGNQTKNGTSTFVYDDRNRLRDYKANGTSVTRTYRYSGRGERVSKVVAAGSSANRYYTYDESGHVLGEYQANGTRVQEYVWLDDTLVGVLSDHDGSTYQYVETDHLGTPRAVIHPAKDKIIWRWNLTNTAFGEHAPSADPDANSITYTFNLRYPGQWYDSESKLHYNYFRDYDPAIGRYVQSDPIGMNGGVSTFSYVNSSPIGLVDPFGLDIVDVRRVQGVVLQQFPELHPRGIVYCGRLDEGIYADANQFSGDITVSERYCIPSCLSEVEWNELFFSLFHESMHSTDRWWEDLSLSPDHTEHHDSIYMREYFERSRARKQDVPHGPVWGSARRVRVDLTSLYAQYRQENPFCKKCSN
ncbi:RHS repeat-associated core domain-containing protein [Arenimonas oryziterrae]|uniref:RHS repeat-associated core domain-containing protein n=1 Tax=Arenimonas oryziterrae TaxID=498055 RepID=UPI00138AC88B|nr:RHS repeat-associated core domain-containing protein [Arenimonas oryziterrae]